MDMFRRIFGLGKPFREPRPSEILASGTDARLVLHESRDPVDIGARENFAMLYGRANLPPHFAMQGVIEVQDGGGNWVPVTGNDFRGVSMEAQTAALQSFRETGIIGPQPINESGSMQIEQSGPTIGGTGVTGPAQIGSGVGGTGAAANAPVQSSEPATLLSPTETDLLATLMTPLGPEEVATPGQARLTDMLLRDLERRLADMEPGPPATGTSGAAATQMAAREAGPAPSMDAAPVQAGQRRQTPAPSRMPQPAMPGINARPVPETSVRPNDRARQSRTADPHPLFMKPAAGMRFF